MMPRVTISGEFLNSRMSGGNVKRATLAVVFLGLVALLTLGLSGCGASSHPISVSATAASNTVDGTDTTTITATVANDKNAAGVNWTTSAGTLSGSTTTSTTLKVPAATSSAQTITVTATSISDSTKPGTVTITVPAAPAITSLTVAQASVAVGTAYSVTLARTGGIGPFKNWAVKSGTPPSCLSLNASTGVLSSPSSPTAACVGVYSNIVFTMQDSGTPNALTATSSAQTITVTGPTITFPSSLGGATVGTAYSASAAATGALGTTTYTLVGSLPASGNLTLNTSTGLITGTPHAADVGTYTFKVSVTDQYGDTSTSGNLSIVIAAAPAITFGTAPTGTATFNVAYSSAVTATGGAGSLTYTLASGALPPDLTLAASGAITGTPKAADIGTWTFAAKAADAFGDSATSTTYTIVVSYPPLTIITTSPLPSGYGNTLYTQQLNASGGSGTGFNWTVTSGTSSLAALSLTLSSGGVLSGTAPLAGGSASFSVKVTDSASNSSTPVAFTLTINPGLSIATTSPLPAGYGNTLYTQPLAASGGSGTDSWTVTSGIGSLAALNLSLSSGGVLSGTPPLAGGSASFGVQVTDSASNKATATFALTINPGVTVTVPSLAHAYNGTPYTSPAFTASGGTNSSFTWGWAAANGSSLPNSLNIGSGTGVVSGTPVNTGTSSVTSNVVVTATDSALNKGTANATIIVEATVAVSSPATLPGVAAGVNPNYQLTATGGSGTYSTWTVTAGSTSLAGVGLSVSPSGVLGGSSPIAGTANFTVTVTDSEGHTSAGASLSVTVSTVLTIQQTTLPSGNVGSSYSQNLTAVGGSGSGFTWSVTSSTLASYGLTFTNSPPNATITGTPTQTGTANFTAQVTDSANHTATQLLSITIDAVISLPPANSLPAGYTKVAYTGSINGSGGSGNLTFSITSALSPSNGTLAANVSGSAVNITGTPTSAATESLTVKLTDNTTGNSTSQTYTFSITAPATLTLPPTNPSSLPAATLNASYTGSITATGGAGPYTWSINTTPVGSGLSLGNGTLIASSNGSATLTISGSPSSTGTVTLTSVKIVDSESPAQSATNTYTIAVNPSGGSISGQVSLNNYCSGGNSSLPVTFTVKATPSSGSPTTTTTDSNGNYTFSNLAFGTYSITVSVSGASSFVSYPASYPNVTLSSGNSSVNGENFNAEVGFNVSGAVSYIGSQTGQVYLYVQSTNCGGGQGSPGNSITEATLTSGGAYTIHGVTPGSYTVNAWMDSTGIPSGTSGYPGQQGSQNANNPTGSSSSSFNVPDSGSNVTGVDVTLNIPTYATPSSNPQLQVMPSDGGVLIFFNPPTVSGTNGNNEEAANEYTVNWAVSNGSDSDGPTCTLGGGTGGGQFSTLAGSHTFYAVGKDATVWVLNNTSMGAGTFAAGKSYCFQARAFNTLASTTHPSGWTTPLDGLGNPAATTLLTSPIFCSSGCTTVSGAVTIPSSVTIKSGAPLYVGMFQQSSTGDGPSAIYVYEIASPVAGGSGNAYSITIPNGSGYVLLGILDQNNDGEIDAGDVTNVRSNNSNGITLSGGTTSGVSTTLPSTGSVATVQTQYSSCGAGCNNYNLQLQVGEANKLPVSVTLYSGPNMLNPVDISSCGCNGSASFEYFGTLPGGTPNVGDEYDFTVTYGDGSVDQGSAKIINGKVIGWNGGSTVTGASDAPTDLQISGSNPGEPNFSWTDSSSSLGSDFSYSFYLSQQDNCTGNCTIWQIPGQNSKSNGFSSSTTSLTWGVDPTGGGSTPTGSLSNSDTYNWTVQAQDSNGNQAGTSANYQP